MASWKYNKHPQRCPTRASRSS